MDSEIITDVCMCAFVCVIVMEITVLHLSQQIVSVVMLKATGITHTTISTTMLFSSLPDVLNEVELTVNNLTVLLYTYVTHTTPYHIHTFIDESVMFNVTGANVTPTR